MSNNVGIAICDDESYFRKTIKRKVAEIFSKAEVSCFIDTFSSGEDFCKDSMNFEKYSVIFLDISMKKMNGMQTAEAIRDKNTNVDIIFVTIMMDMEYLVGGYKVDAFRYVIKEDLDGGLSECVNAFLDKHRLNEKRLTFPFIGGSQTISINQLVFVESYLHKLCFLFLNEKLYLYEKLDTIEKMLAEFHFVRIHKSYLVNLKYIAKISGYKVYLRSGEVLPVAKTRYPSVKEKYIQYKENM